MKATLTFDLDDPDDRELHQDCLNAPKYKMFIDEFYEKVLRPIRKWGPSDEQTAQQQVIKNREDKYYIELEYLTEMYGEIQEDLDI